MGSGSVDSPELRREQTADDSEEPSKLLATIPSPDVNLVLASLREHCTTNVAEVVLYGAADLRRAATKRRSSRPKSAR